MSRRLWEIPGGVHPPLRKEQSRQAPIQPVALPPRLVLSLQQHIGAAATPLVKVGDPVLKGQKIAEAKGFVSAPLHAPSSGTVVSIEPHPVPHPSGMEELSIIIDTDGEERWCDLAPCPDYHQLDASELLARIREAGIAGLGGAGFPSAVKLSARPEQEVRTLIINGTECEPYISADDRLMRERSEALVTGIDILNQILKPEEVLIAIEDDKPEAIQALRRQISDQQRPFEVVVLPTKYPSGGEKQLIQILTGCEVPSGELPADLGILCQNVGTTAAIRDAVIEGRPLISRITTLTGEAIAEPGNREVLIGTPVNHLLALAGVDEQRLKRLVIGGPMMGFSLEQAQAPITKTVNCVIAATASELPPPPPAQACIRCGACAEVCPVNLLPQQLYWHARAKDYSQLRHHNLFDCIECGACSYSCPSHIPLVQYYRASKADIRAHEAMQQKAEYSRIRFEAREARLQRMEEEKAAKRKANAERAAKLKAAKQASASQPAAPADSEDKALKIQRAKVAAEIKKLNRQLEAAASEEQSALKASIAALESQLELLQPSPSAPPPPSSDDSASDDKAARIKLAMAKAAVKKAERALASAEQAGAPLEALEAELAQQRAALQTLEPASGEATVPTGSRPPPSRAPLSEAQKKLKIEAAMARAALKKAERAYADAAQSQSAGQQGLEEEVARLREDLDSALAKLEASADAAPQEATPAVSTPAPQPAEDGEAELKRLKIRQAMARAALKKAQRALDKAPDNSDPGLTEALKAAERELAQATLALDGATTETSGG
ncbi:electron transport complex subunit RsxC [Aestuariirhabdus litorea]|uniref:Ion-translocating oxidoreductase complex subunit C n=1 Tax=Aestuariirhabdus litorea TaxID=2528527 RepID=A0A3P3VT26_9GAMM|nr:electron transport complex subunit RsxC [Aestuariirhabdus litorea]RRJ85128.1 electron transport complex subunit RsxC [Aestuariirhabdus litorea]RWW98352.1 electron transport complex subunit RsxC [Endozoicomonadaceae bacterium GTF-13]